MKTLRAVKGSQRRGARSGGKESVRKCLRGVQTSHPGHGKERGRYPQKAGVITHPVRLAPGSDAAAAGKIKNACESTFSPVRLDLPFE
jgi:hypothetical protein